MDFRVRHHVTSLKEHPHLLIAALLLIGLDVLAMRPITVDVETFRRDGLSDEEVIVLAVEEAYALSLDGWWIRRRNPRLLFDNSRRYEVHPAFFELLHLRPVSVTGQELVAELDTR